MFPIRGRRTTRRDFCLEALEEPLTLIGLNPVRVPNAKLTNAALSPRTTAPPKERRTAFSTLGRRLRR